MVDKPSYGRFLSSARFFGTLALVRPTPVSMEGLFQSMATSKTVCAAICAGIALFAIESLQAAPRQVFQNHVPRAVAESRGLGPVSQMARLELTIGLPLRNRDELDRILDELSDPQSPNYRRYLSASEFAERFGPAQEDYDKLIVFLQANGFAISGTHPNRMILNVSGSVSAIERTFHLGMRAWMHKTRGQFFAPDRDPSLDFEVSVLDITGLDNFVLPTPMDVKATPLNSATPFVSGSGPAGLFIGKDFRAAYAPGVTRTGAGQTIGLIEFDGFYAADVQANFQHAGLSPSPVQTVLLDGFNGSAGGSNIEVILDIMMAAYMAPGATIVVYEGYNWNNILNRMATDNIAKQLSCSWGFSPINATTEQIFKQMIAQGQSFLQASGDSGAYSGWIMPPSDNPNVTVVGGTALSTAGPGGQWLSESTWGGSGGGVSTTYVIPNYQQGMNFASLGGSNTMRNIPDVALTAAIQMYLIYNNGQQVSVGGTSAAAPLWGGFIALANEQAAASGKPPVGFLNPAIYALGKGANYARDLHDITIGSNGFGAIPGFDLATGWGTPFGQPLIDDLTSIAGAPTFVLSAPPIAVTIGSSATATIQITAQNGFSGSVNLSLSGLPSGVTGTFGAISPSGASALTLIASSGAASGTYTLPIQGVSGAITSSVGLSLQVTKAPVYTLTTSAAALTVAPGSTGTATITVAPANGFNSPVSLTISSLPAGVTASFNPASTSTASTLGFVATAGATVGTSTVMVTGKSGTLAATVAIALTIAPPASFSLTTSASAVSVVPGASVTGTITVTPKNGFTGKVTLTTSGLPSGVTASFNPATTATTSVVTFIATAATAPGTSTVTVAGSSGITSTAVTLSLTVKGAPGFTLAPAPAALSITQGTSASSTITVAPLNGFAGLATLTVAGLPGGVTAAFSPASTSSTSKLTLTAAALAAAGSATLTIKGTSGAISAQTALVVTVAAAPSFKLSSSTSNVKVAAGSTGTTIINVAPQGGFAGSVALAATGLPTGITASFNPATTKTTSSLTLTASSSTVAKASTFTIMGTSGTLTVPLTMTVTVTPPPDFTLTLSPASLNVMQGGKGASAIAVTAINGFTGNVMLSVSGLPNGVTSSFGTLSNPGLLIGTFAVSNTAVAATSKVTVTATAGSLIRSAVLNLTVVAPTVGTASVDLSPFYNVSASAVDNVPFTDGGLDALGRSYSGVLLGSSQSVGGTVFGLGPMGVSDAVSGQTVMLPASQFSTLRLLATGVNGNQAGQAVIVTYTDGTTTSVTQGFSDWYTPNNYPGESKAVTMNYRDNSTGTRDGRIFYLYGYSFNLDSAKTVKSIALPKNRNVIVLAINLVSSPSLAVATQVDLSNAFNGIGIISDGKLFAGGLDGVGYAYSGSLLLGNPTFNSVQFRLAPTDTANVVSGATSAIALPGGKYSGLAVLATAVNGAQLSQTFQVGYSDGSSSTFTQNVSEWFIPNSYAGEFTALTMPYRNAAAGTRDNRKFALYQYTFPLNSSKTVTSIVLPANKNVKVFAITLKP